MRMSAVLGSPLQGDWAEGGGGRNGVGTDRIPVGLCSQNGRVPASICDQNQQALC